MTITRQGWAIKSSIHLTIQSIGRVKAVKVLSITNKEVILITRGLLTEDSVTLNLISSLDRPLILTLIKTVLIILILLNSSPLRAHFKRIALVTLSIRTDMEMRLKVVILSMGYDLLTFNNKR